MPPKVRAPGRRVRGEGFSSFVPDPLPPALTWTPELVRALSDADRAVGRLAGEGGRLPNQHLLLRPFIQREAVLSSKIEGTQATLGELLAAEAGAVVERSPADLREVNEQTRKGVTGTPKGLNRRTVPMTTTLLSAVKGLDVIRRGLVVRNENGSALTDGQTTHTIYRICRRAGLPEEGWHPLRHSFGTHAAMFGVNPWRLMVWMGHKSMTETLRYVHLAEDHPRPLPEVVLAAAQGEPDPDRRIIRMLGARVAAGWQLAVSSPAGEEAQKQGG